ncbi:hypothetical protein IFM89_025127 [Coptis chinensis]|uniref:Uncharacterized protein n=1 Tax=Coptis chinensis TaxID=261450 RepID=A0A835MDH3_9MAGN|nr:hypothetical protein IFM89_025127 [Coptis chinensis]
MASVATSASLQRAFSSHRVIKKHNSILRPTCSLGAMHASNVATIDVESKKMVNMTETHERPVVLKTEPVAIKSESMPGTETELSDPMFSDERWKNGTWDLNMFVKNGKLDWDSVIVAGRAAMIGFFMAYFVDVLTGLDVVGQTGNVICKAGLLITVLGVVAFRKSEDIGNLQKLLDEATFYDKQWQATWQDQSIDSSSNKKDKPTK